MSTTTTTTTTPTFTDIAENINKALERSAEAGQASLRRAYGADRRQGAPKNLATSIKYARDAMRVYAGDADLPNKGERRTFLQRIIAALDAAEVITETLVVEAARDVIAADRKRRKDLSDAKAQTKREQAAALTDAARRGDPAAAAEIVSLMAADRAERNAEHHDTALAKFARAVSAALDAGITVREMESVILDAASAK